MAFYKNISYFQADFVLIKMVLYLPNFSLVFLIHVFLYAGVYCIPYVSSKSKIIAYEQGRLQFTQRPGEQTYIVCCHSGLN